MHRTRRRTLLAIGGLAYRGPARRDDPGGPTGSGSTEGGSGSTDEGGQGSEGGQGDDSGSKTPEIKGEFDPERHARALAAAREGERKAKAETKVERERVAAILKAAGLTPDGKEDPAEQLKAARESADKATAKARQTAVELAVYKSAGKAGADPDAVLDSRGFLAAVADLDPEDGEFNDKVTAAIKAAVKSNAKLAAGTAGQGSGTGRQGADHTGGSGGRSRSTSLTDAVKRKLGG
ncbi:hypothetical protein [Micromonospora sp. NPDC003816]|uniref:hypothetical protein n=1 Tax=Micromonospora sp. NPDC003816 TaxID=3364224 RepID=UPI00368EC91F